MKSMFDNPSAYSYSPEKPDSDITIMFTRKRKKGGEKDSSAVIPRPLLKKIIAGLQMIDREMS